ncbi:hypothetical protein [Streptomyces hydrogenans]|uniref:Uncharacterized protein n=1 Tax=Streptomyces hydrogenans TaxID=1873719 RepID=A0ABQ3PJH4_9ACTN|nr:hypothetical protein [Streptomyces hydrogenans]GHF94615.1 hypothetical protein GCM10018784_02850 [Streptomyces hydrogenans]GHI25159.1 hypothetical protein Shyd_65300 [Streptomyces hydrogenans]
MSHIWRSKRRREQKSAATVFVVQNQGRPVASTDDAAVARGYIHTRVDIGFAYTTTAWTTTGKFLVNGRWSGWEIREVRAI